MFVCMCLFGVVCVLYVRCVCVLLLCLCCGLCNGDVFVSVHTHVCVCLYMRVQQFVVLCGVWDVCVCVALSVFV